MVSGGLPFNLRVQKTKKVVCLIIVSMTLLGGAASSYATPIVAPNALATAEGNSNNCIPTVGCLDYDRYQQVFNASEFAATTGPVLISQIAFRREFAGSFSNSFSNVVIGLSTTTASADGLSSTFASNTGADYTEVRSGAMTVSSASSAGGLTPFDIIINFSTAFLYDSSLGNLLLDWQNFGSEEAPFGSLDAHNESGDSISRIVGGGVTATTATLNDSRGLVAQLEVSAVPEPSSLIILSLGLLGLRMRRRQKH